MPFDRSKGERDPKVFRALAHPLRMRIDEQLSLKGPMTATELSELLGESPSNCSFHLRTMAKYGFIQEAEGGKGRERRWKGKSGYFGVDEEDLDPEAKVEWKNLQSMQRQFRDAQRARWEERKAEFPEEWRHGVWGIGWEGVLTIQELGEIAEGFGEVLKKYQGRPNPKDGVRVHIDANSLPIGDPPVPQEKPKPAKKAQKRSPRKKST